nr:YiiX/YebB-like N1pC/P60 family cysteine hydrolase [Reinekea sp. G2M2-21]
MGKVKVWRIGKTLITPEQALAFSRNFEPGDFYLTRKEWRLTNVGIPGFWTHSAMFIGTPTERALYFNTPEINAWVSSMGAESYEDLLRQTSRIYDEHPGYDDGGDIRVIEALDAGVIFNSIETSLDADGAAVFRPMVSRLEKAKAIYASFLYTGQPYDFHFDFDSDNALVCSELIYKAYQPSANQSGLEFPLYRAVGNKMLTPSEIARWYDETVGTPDQKIELVMFIDSNEKDGVAFQSTKEAFIGSWKRPDWYLFQQPERRDDRVATN